MSLFDHYEEPAKHVPAPPKHAVMVGGANLGKPYPPVDGKVSITPKRARVKSSDEPSPVAQKAPAAPAAQRAAAPVAPAPRLLRARKPQRFSEWKPQWFSAQMRR